MMEQQDVPQEPTAPVQDAPSAAPSPRLRFMGAVLVFSVGVAGVVFWPKDEPPPPTTTVSAVPRVDDGAIVVPSAFRERLGITTVEAVAAPLTPLVRATGTVTFDPEVSAAVSTRIRGNVRRLLKVEGDTVKKGEVVAEIESAELGTAQSELTIARANLKASEANLTREQALHAKQLSTGRELEVARANVERDRALLLAAEQKVRALGGEPNGPFGIYLIRAPMAGTVVERRLAQGQSVDGSEVIYETTDLDKLWVEIDVFNPHIESIRKGDEVELHPLSNPDDITRGSIAHVGEVIDLETRSARMRVDVDNRSRRLRPGQSLVAAIKASGPARTTLVVPRSAITLVDGKATVFVEESVTHFLARVVETGVQDGAMMEILSGLEAGERVVVRGVFGLKSELFR